LVWAGTAEAALKQVLSHNAFFLSALADYPRFLADGVFDSDAMAMLRQRVLQSKRRQAWKVRSSLRDWRLRGRGG
jgi:hypothetical protein